MILEIYDLECLTNVFTYTGYCPKENKWYQFVVAPWLNQYIDLISHLKRDKLIQVGFNNIGYDYPLEHHLLNHYNEYKELNGLELTSRIYSKSQEIIDSEFSAIARKNEFIYQIDLYKIWHYNNKARTTS